MDDDGHRAASTDDGFGIVEVLVAMLMLALLAVAFLPVLISGLRLTASNSTITTAAQMVSEQLNLARSQTATCSALTAFQSSAAPAVTDGAGKTLSAVNTLTCPTSYPGTATFTTKVTASGSTTVLATAGTLIFVSTS